MEEMGVEIVNDSLDIKNNNGVLGGKRGIAYDRKKKESIEVKARF